MNEKEFTELANKVLSLGKQKGNQYIKDHWQEYGKKLKSSYDCFASRLIEDLKSKGVGSDDELLIALEQRTWSQDSKNKWEVKDMNITDYDILRMYVDWTESNEDFRAVSNIVKEARARKAKIAIKNNPRIRFWDGN